MGYELNFTETGGDCQVTCTPRAGGPERRYSFTVPSGPVLHEVVQAVRRALAGSPFYSSLADMKRACKVGVWMYSAGFPYEGIEQLLRLRSMDELVEIILARVDPQPAPPPAPLTVQLDTGKHRAAMRKYHRIRRQRYGVGRTYRTHKQETTR